ncbi:PadR family transcriptional regulator [Acholeplasma sp. OttesenSCG-928-E16]|nr:PadR family transcriptional regulator [Acholeplasma sp. OttesenSCG-928-E16]
MINSQFKKGIVEICILSLIKRNDLYGFEVIDKLAKIDVNENTIYPILRRLTQQGLFKTYQVENPNGPARKYYKITQMGALRLEEYENDWKKFLKNVMEILEGEQKNGI